MARKGKVTITRTKVVGGALYSKGGEYQVDKETALALKAAGALGDNPPDPGLTATETEDNGDNAK
jgi:hypothetical protein